MRLEGKTYAEVRTNFRWELPARFNIATAVCDRHAEATPDAPALTYVEESGPARVYSFAELRTLTCRFANALEGLGVGVGTIVGLNLPQTPELLIAHIALQRMGAIGLPLFPLFGPDAIRYRLIDSGARVLVTTPEGYEKVAGVIGDIETLRHVVMAGREAGGPKSFWRLLEAGAPDRPAIDTSAEDPAILMYTSGTTGNPKGVLHAQRALLGQMPGHRLIHNLAPQPGDRYWTPSDWNWAGGLNQILPSLYLGTGIIGARRAKFDPEWAVDFMGRHQVRNALIAPTGLRFMRAIPPERVRGRCNLRSMLSGGEKVGDDVIAWGREAFGITISEGFGQTEVNLVVCNSPELFEPRPGAMGRAVPGYTVEVIDGAGQVLPPGTPGLIAVDRSAPALMLRYWNRPEATAERFIGDWFTFGDTASKDADGYFTFQGRDDDIINSASYRIGPAEIEDCLMSHPAVRVAGVVGSPDKMRGEVVVAFIVPAEGVATGPELASEIQVFVREKLAAHEYPRRIHFIAEMPMTVTGKVRRLDLRELDRKMK
jgi:acetyl-CoA synthetase